MNTVLGLVLLAATAYAIPVDNGVQGDPEIECGPTSITVTFNTENNFEGHVYVKNLFDKSADGCRTSGDGSRAVGQIELNHFEDSCNVQRTRSENPKGIFVRSTVVISFHPRFLTKVDRAYTIQCFYMEADKTVSTDIEVSMITTGFQTQFVPMPVCRYEILDAADGGNPVQFAIIGQPVYHVWTCDTDTTDTFCMFVKQCYVDDGAGDRLDLVNEDGCSFDQYLIGDIEYPSDLQGVKEVHVFKYADRPALQFQCQIEITVKEPNGECPRPECSLDVGGGDGDGQPNIPPSPINGRRSRRSAVDAAGLVDVAAEFEALDISDKPVHMPHSRNGSPVYITAPATSTDAVCMSSTAVTMAGVLLVAIVGVAVTVAVSMGRRQK